MVNILGIKRNLLSSAIHNHFVAITTSSIIIPQNVHFLIILHDLDNFSTHSEQY